jgi:hypothetical protein
VNIPNSGAAIVKEAKITGYLLSHEHPVGRFKAAFFRSFGFERDRWEELRQALVEHAAANEIVREETTPHGQRYVLEGPLRSPDGRSPSVRCIWFIRSGQASPEFVTAYPLKGKSP